jgi:hypothetical protein
LAGEGGVEPHAGRHVVAVLECVHGRAHLEQKHTIIKKRDSSFICLRRNKEKSDL